MVLVRNTLTFTDHIRQFVYKDLLLVSRFYWDLKVATDGLQHGHIEFFKRVAVVSFTQVIRVVADGMRDVDFPVYHVYQILSVRILLQALNVFILVRRQIDRTQILIFATLCCQPQKKLWTWVLSSSLFK